MTLNDLRIKLFILSVLLTIFTGVFVIQNHVHADSNGIEVVSHGVTSQFPDGLTFSVAAKSSKEIVEIAVRFKVGIKNPEYMNILNLYRVKPLRQIFSGIQIPGRNIYPRGLI